VVDNKDFGNPINTNKVLRPRNAIKAAQDVTPNQCIRSFACFNTRKWQVGPYRRVFSLLRYPALDLVLISLQPCSLLSAFLRPRLNPVESFRGNLGVRDKSFTSRSSRIYRAGRMTSIENPLRHGGLKERKPQGAVMQKETAPCQQRGGNKLEEEEARGRPRKRTI